MLYAAPPAAAARPVEPAACGDGERTRFTHHSGYADHDIFHSGAGRLSLAMI